MACLSDIEGFYNPLRRHAALGDRSPVVYEQETASELPTDILISQVP